MLRCKEVSQATPHPSKPLLRQLLHSKSIASACHSSQSLASLQALISLATAW